MTYHVRNLAEELAEQVVLLFDDTCKCDEEENKWCFVDVAKQLLAELEDEIDFKEEK